MANAAGQVGDTLKKAGNDAYEGMVKAKDWVAESIAPPKPEPTTGEALSNAASEVGDTMDKTGKVIYRNMETNAQDAKEAVRDTALKAGDAVQEGAQKTSDAVKDTTQRAKDSVAKK